MRLISRAVSIGAGFALGLMVAVGTMPALAQQPPQLPQSVVELTRVKDDVYAFRSGGYVSLFVVTDEGVVVVDPIGGGGGAKAPALLKATIASVTDQPVKYLIYSHAAADHNTGGITFADTATIIGQERSTAKIAARNDPNSPAPTQTFDDSMSLDVGGKHFELKATKLNANDDYLIFWYPAAKVIMTVDMIRAKTLPFQDLQAASPENMAAFLENTLNTYDFDVFLYGHGNTSNFMGNRQDVADHRQYYLDLVAAVKAAKEAGHADNSEAMIGAVREALAPKYGSWATFPNALPQNISGVIRWMGM